MVSTFLFWLAALVILLLSAMASSVVPSAYKSLAWGLPASLALYALARWFALRRTLAVPDAGLRHDRRTIARLGAGLAIGVATYGVTLGTNALLFGPIRFAVAAEPDMSAALIFFGGLAATVLMEELAFRSFAFWNSIAVLGGIGGQLLVALAFALLHIGYGWPLETVLLGVLPSAVLFGAAAYVSRSLALPFGVHFGVVCGRTISGESGNNLILAMDTSGVDAGMAAAFAPYVSAAVPLLVAVILFCLYRKRAA